MSRWGNRLIPFLTSFRAFSRKVVSHRHNSITFYVSYHQFSKAKRFLIFVHSTTIKRISPSQTSCGLIYKIKPSTFSFFFACFLHENFSLFLVSGFSSVTWLLESSKSTKSLPINYQLLTIKCVEATKSNKTPLCVSDHSNNRKVLSLWCRPSIALRLAFPEI